MTYPKIKPCPKCGSDDVAVYTFESGWKRVECLVCRRVRMMNKRNTGLINKFKVTRTDGTDRDGGKHFECDYFVLDLTHDPHALPALRAYMNSCLEEYPALAFDLAEKCGQMKAAIKEGE